MKWILIFLCLPALGQLPVLPFAPSASSSSAWFPTNSANPLVLWADLILPGGATANTLWDGATHPVGDNEQVTIWTNLAQASSKWTADQALHPTNFVAGAGTNTSGPRILFTAANTTRMVGGSWPVTTNKATFVIVANCTATSGTDNIIMNGTGTPSISYVSKALQINSAATPLNSATTMTTNYYVITAVFASDASSHIDTNGVTMVTGNAGSGNMATIYLGQFNSPCFHGNISRVWAWSGVLSAGDLTSAVNQCRKDFGI